MKRILLLYFIAMLFIPVTSWAIDFWQPYPMTAVVTHNGNQVRVEFTCFDSLLGTFQHFNTPYYNDSNIILTSSTGAVIGFNTYLWTARDTCFGFVIYDYVLHQFAPEYHAFGEGIYGTPSSGAYLSVKGAMITYTTAMDAWMGARFENSTTLIYDIQLHSWQTVENVGGIPWYGISQVVAPGDGLASCHVYETDDFIDFRYYDPVLNTGVGGRALYVNADYNTNNQDLFAIYDNGSNDNDAAFFAYDPTLHTWSWFGVPNAISTNDIRNHGMVFSTDRISGVKYFAIYDDSLHRWAIDSTALAISRVTIKDRLVAYYDSSNFSVCYQAFSPTMRRWVKDSSVTAGLNTMYIQDAAVKWKDSTLTAYMAGYSDTIGWGNFYTPIQLSFHLTDMYPTTGKPLIFVRNYSLGTNNVWYDFGDGITTSGLNQQSLWHLFKVNNSYDTSYAVNYNVCIHGGTLSSCQSGPMACSAHASSTYSCVGNCNGAVLMSPVNGIAPFTYQWSTGATTSAISSLCSGSYSVTVRDSTGCSAIYQINVGEPPPIILSTGKENNEGCNPIANGKASVLSGSSSPPYSYLWSPSGGTGSHAFNLPGGTYTVTVTDGHGCTDTATTTIYNVPGLITSVSSLTLATCDTCCNGRATVTATGGIANSYTYEWIPGGQTGQTDSLMCVGTYSVVITDSHGCVDTLVIDIINGINDYNIEGNGLEIYPNPANERLFVNRNSLNRTEIVLEFYNSIGEKVYTNIRKEKEVVIYTANFSAGIYLLKITSVDKIITKKIIIEN